MEIILLERIERLGKLGDVVNVKPGFARNFLLPKGKAMRANEANRKIFEAQRAELEATYQKRRTDAEGIAGNVDGTVVTLIRQAGAGGQLYGSVNSRDIAAALGQAGHSIARSQVILDKPIKTLGLFPVKVILFSDVEVQVTANVARSEEEAKLQAETGRAFVAQEESSQGFGEDLPEDDQNDELGDELGDEQHEAVEESDVI